MDSFIGKTTDNTTVAGKKPSVKNVSKPTDAGETMETSNQTIGRESVNKTQLEAVLNVTNAKRGQNINGDNLSYRYSDSEMKDVEMYVEDKNKHVPQWQGIPSIFNSYAVFRHPRCNNANDFLVTDNNKGGVFGESNGIVNPKLSDLLSEYTETKHPSDPYYASDFLYAKYYKKIPLNRLITLRRFPFPTYGNLTFGNGKNYKPLAQAVTFFGEETGNTLSEISKITGTIAWKEITADVWNVEGNETSYDKETGYLGSYSKDIKLGKKSVTLDSDKIKEGVKYLNPKNDLGQKRADAIEAERLYDNEDYTNKVLGPVNVVHKTHIRDRGIGAELQLKLVFEYELKSYHGINMKLAMIDLISNFLALTFNNAKFWGGSNRYFPNSPQFASFGDENKLFSGDYSGYLSSVAKTLGGGLGIGLDITNNIFGGLLSGNFGNMKKGLSQMFSGVMDVHRANARPNIVGFKALLTGQPVGEYHITLGNPFRPIYRIGNLICESWDMEFSDQLSIEDFPTGVKFTVNLKSGRPLDKGDIESLLLEGNGRSYYSEKGMMDVLNKSSATGIDMTSNKPKRTKDEMKRAAGSAF